MPIVSLSKSFNKNRDEIILMKHCDEIYDRNNKKNEFIRRI